MNKKICRLCLQTISGNYQELGETLENVLKLNLGVSRETVMCMECANSLEVFLNLKSACVDLRERALLLTEMRNDVSLYPVTTENTVNIKSVKESNNDTRCSFCTQSIERERLTTLLESKENMFLVDMLKKYIPELNLSNNEELLICKVCLDNMESVSNFLMKCVNVEENINEYAEIKERDGKGQIELQDVQRFILNPTLKLEEGTFHINELEQTYDQIQETFLMKAEAEIKNEIEVDDLEPNIKVEFVHVKLEQNNCNGFQELSTKLDDGDKSSPDPSLYKCETDNYETTHKYYPKDHMFTQESHSQRKMFKCETCAFETKSKQYLYKHKLTHRSPSEIIMYKCDICTYETKYKQHLKPHKLVHKDPSDITMLKCGLCNFETKRKNALKTHMLIHKSPSEVITYKCDTCSYETKLKHHLNGHKLTHLSPTEITMFKCELCSFETKHKSNINKHMALTHKHPSEVTLYRCGSCTFETKYKRYLKVHSLTHKNPSEIPMFKCALCPFEAKVKYTLKVHVLTHRNPSEVPMFKCETCTFSTKRKRNLVQHKLIHEDSSDVTMFKCQRCTYQTRHSGNLRKHNLAHKYPSNPSGYECEKCPFKTKYKAAIASHMLNHNKLTPDNT